MKKAEKAEENKLRAETAQKKAIIVCTRQEGKGTRLFPS
jgi:hypothetical protein